MSQPSWLKDYIGIPFKDDGLTRKGLHCWGLVRLVYAEQAKIELPSYGEHNARDLLAASRLFSAEPAKWVTPVRPYRIFDVVLMTAMHRYDGANRRLAAHCGVMVSERHMLHVWSETDSVVMTLDHPRVRHKIVGIYRHGDLAA